MISFHLDAAGAMLNFVGSVILTADLVRARSRSLERTGWSTLVQGMKRTGKSTLFKDESGAPLSDARADHGMAGRASRIAVWGICFIVAGFAIDLLCKTTGMNPSLIPK